MHASTLETPHSDLILGMNVCLWLFQPLQKRAIHMAQRMLGLHKHLVQCMQGWDIFVHASVVYLSGISFLCFLLSLVSSLCRWDLVAMCGLARFHGSA